MILFGYSNRTHIRQLFRWQIELEKLVQELAEIVVLHPGGISSSVSGQLAASGKLLTAQLGDFHQDLLREVVRLPSCFRSFDEEPEDLKRIVDGFADRWPDRQTPLMVIGVRTSGNYLGPLYAALLRDQGYHNVKFLSIRPGRQLFYSEKSELKTLSQMRGLALIADDPPSTGDTLAQVGEELKRSNIPASSIILLLQLFGSRDTLPAQLQGYPSILLPWDDWKIHERLVPSAVQMDLSCLMHPTISVARVERLPHLDLQLARQHIQAVYQVRLVDRSSNHSWEQRVRVRGVGMGYFGGHSLAVTQRMGEFLPKVYGLVSGLLYQLELPQEGRLNSIEPENEAALAKEMATYVVARNRALAVMEDTSLQLPDRLTAWSAASEIVSQAFGRARRLARIIAVDASIKRLLQVRIHLLSMGVWRLQIGLPIIAQRNCLSKNWTLMRRPLEILSYSAMTRSLIWRIWQLAAGRIILQNFFAVPMKIFREVPSLPSDGCFTIGCICGIFSVSMNWLISGKSRLFRASLWMFKRPSFNPCKIIILKIF